jgi:preprotein translocase subunit SecD
MINRYPLWKNLLILVLILGGIVYALPNLYGQDPAVQVSPAASAEVDAALKERVEAVLQEREISAKRLELGDNQLLVRFKDTEDQLKAVDYIDAELGTPYTVALNLAPSTPEWLRALDASPMYLGLDLRGGVHFLMEVDMEAAVRIREESYVSDLRNFLRQQKALRAAENRYVSLTRDARGIWIKFRNAAARDLAADLVEDEFRDLDLERVDDENGNRLLLRLSEQEKRDAQEFALKQNITTLRNRVNELGVAEPVIQQQGANRVVVQLPGVQDTARAKDILGATATLEFRLVEKTPVEAEEAAATGRVPPGTRLYYDRDDRPYLLNKRVIITGDYITDASSGIEQQGGSPAVFITLNGKGASIMSKATRDKIGRQMAVVFIEAKRETRFEDGEKITIKRVDERIINAAVIRDQLGKRFQISGLDSTREARNLALLLRAGALAAPIDIIEERTVGPSLGRENIEQGFNSVVVGMIVVLIFMAIYYKVFGLVADLALVTNLVLIVAVLSLFQATLTLPGIAGIVLTVGMAVDANVLIFERIREELRAGNSPQASIHAGYEKALSTIADANVTTFIAALVLFAFGTGPVKGFAVTLSIGILTSMFTAILGTRAVINLIYGGRRVAALAI